MLFAVTPAAVRRAHERLALPGRGARCSAACSSRYAVRHLRDYSDALARRTFRYSIIYLALLFAALLVDHYLR